MEDFEKYMNKIVDPVVFGPGYWRVFHILGKEAKTYHMKINYARTVEVVINSIPCMTCREDALEYLSNVPVTSYWNIGLDGEDVGMFYWSVDFHNYVNRKLGKEEISRETAYQYYYQDIVCTEGCGQESTLHLNKSIGFRPV